MNTKLIYVHDPMCSWCFGFAEVYLELVKALDGRVEVKRLLGGLAADTDEPMPQPMQLMLQQSWQKIEQVIPGKKFNFDFWTLCKPRRSTYPASRGVIAAREQGEKFDLIMTQHIQKAYYKEARNPSDNNTLIELATEIGLDKTRFEKQLLLPETQQQLLDEINLARSMGINSFPSLLLEREGNFESILTSYTDMESMLQQIEVKL